LKAAGRQCRTGKQGGHHPGHPELAQDDPLLIAQHIKTPEMLPEFPEGDGNAAHTQIQQDETYKKDNQCREE
jgi:hypothetical protein